MTTSRCGATPPSFGAGATAFSPSLRANLAFTATAPVVMDGNSTCPARFCATGYTYAFAVVSKPASASASITGSGGSASITATQGGTYAVQVVATASPGLSTVRRVECRGERLRCVPAGRERVHAVAGGADASGGTTGVTDAAATGATLTAGGAATSARGFYVGSRCCSRRP